MSSDKTLASFRRSAYAGHIHALLKDRLHAARRQGEDAPVTEENSVRVRVIREELQLLFGDDGL